MDFLNTLRLALRALARNKMRSSLTMLGIIIGVGAVIATVSIGQGATLAIEASIQSMGTNAVFIGAGSNRPGGVRMGMWGVKTLTMDDLKAIVNEIPIIQEAAPVVMSRAQIVFQNQNWNASVNGTTPVYFNIRRWPVETGSSFTDEEVESASNVCVLGATVADILFQGADPIGQTVRIRNLPFRVVGILERKGQSMGGDDQDDRIFAPYTTVQRKMAGITWLQYINASAVSQEASMAAVPQVESLLRDRHRIQPGDDDDFFVRTQSEVADVFTSTSRVMTLLLGSVAAVSLVVGG
ncbi:MAG TPA: ABC transporter permease, partial [Candidatus Acidoferrales bacterium]